jgi:hypothetical protein
MTRKEKVKEIFEENGIFVSEGEMDNLTQAISETLELIADETEKSEPYATNTIGRIREVASSLSDEINDDELFEDEQ